MRLIVGVSGASGVVMAYRLLQTLRECTDYELHLVVTEAAERTWDLETDLPYGALLELADVVYDPGDMAASISSGSFVTAGMIILPCSMKTLAGIVSGYTDNLLLRAADVCLKENRKLVICPREMPLGKVHLRNMYEAANLGCAVVPPMLSFYQQPKNIDAQIDQVIGKILLQFGVESPYLSVWE